MLWIVTDEVILAWEPTMTIWVAIHNAIEELRIDKRLKNVEIRLGNLNQIEVYVA